MSIHKREVLISLLSRSSVACAILFLIFQCLVVHAQERMSEIVDKVRANEELYRNIEVVVNKTYRLGTPKFSNPRFLTSASAKTRQVSQKNLLYFRNDEKQERIDGESYRMDSLQGFDGDRTRVVEQNAIANIHLGRWEDPRLVRPHTVLLSRDFVGFPLSVYLKGGAAVREQPAFVHKKWTKSNLTTTFEEEEVVDGLNCCKVRCELRTDGSPPKDAFINFLWLAIERDFIPIKLEACSPEHLSNLPYLLGRVEQLREIAPGIWFPIRYSLTHYDAEWLKEGKVVVNNSEKYVVEKAAIDPNYDMSLFRKIPIPKGFPVYVVKDGKIIESYVEGEP